MSTSENKPAQHCTLNSMVVGNFRGRESLDGHDEKVLLPSDCSFKTRMEWSTVNSHCFLPCCISW